MKGWRCSPSGDAKGDGFQNSTSHSLAGIAEVAADLSSLGIVRLPRLPIKPEFDLGRIRENRGPHG
jgi:hypothetical protein